MRPCILALVPLTLFGCDIESHDVRESVRTIGPELGDDHLDETALHDFYNVQRAIQAGNRGLVARRMLRSLDRTTLTVAELDLPTAEVSRVQERLRMLHDRMEGLEDVRDWRLEAEALNHAILALDRELSNRVR